MHISSGTTGQATAVFYTKADLELWADLLARCMYMAGARPGDTFQNLSGYGLFTGGLGFQYGAERLGMLTIPSGAGNSKRQIQIMRDFSTSVIHIIPSFFLLLMDVMKEMGVDPQKELSLRIAFVGAEPYSEEVRRRLEDFYGVKVYNSYGLSEMNGPGVAFECPYQSGLHVWEDAYLVEIIRSDYARTRAGWTIRRACVDDSQAGGYAHPALQDQRTSRGYCRAYAAAAVFTGESTAFRAAQTTCLS